jgi:hypothetical protein
MDIRITNQKPPDRPRGLSALPSYLGANDPRPEEAPPGERLLHDAPVALALGCGVPVALLLLFLVVARYAALLPWPW